MERWNLDEMLTWLRQSIDCGHSGQAADEARQIVRYCRTLLNVQNVQQVCEPQAGQMAFTESDYRRAVFTKAPGLFALVANGRVLCARRGGCWYEPQGLERTACIEALNVPDGAFSREVQS